MAHKDLIDGTAYEIDGGKAMVDGTVYEIDKGTTLVDGTAYEVGFSGKPCTVTIKAYQLGLWTALEGKTYVTLDGQTYKTAAYDAVDVATVIVPAGTVMSCFLNTSGFVAGQFTVNVNDVTVATGNPNALTQYDYTVNGNIVVVLTMNGTGGGSFSRLLIDITEAPSEDCIAFTITHNLSGGLTGTNPYFAEDGMTWSEWAKSEYNTDGWFVAYDGSAVYHSNGTDYVTTDGSINTAVKGSDLIITGYSYRTY